MTPPNPPPAKRNLDSGNLHRAGVTTDDPFIVAIHTAAHLPGIPTRAWCSRAASAIALAYPKRPVLVALGIVSEDGVMREVENVSVAATGAEDAKWEELIALAYRPGWTAYPGKPAQAPRIIEGDSKNLLRRARGVTHVCAGVWSVAPGSNAEHLVIHVACDDDSDDVMNRLAPLGALAQRVARRAFPVGGKVRWITEREQEVVDMLALGHTVPEISKALERSPHTIHDHIKKIHHKLAVSNRGELVARALGAPTMPIRRLSND